MSDRLFHSEMPAQGPPDLNHEGDGPLLSVHPFGFLKQGENGRSHATIPEEPEKEPLRKHAA